MSIKVWFSDPFITSTEVSPMDVGTTSGTDYTLTNKTTDLLGRTIEYGSTQKDLWNGGYEKIDSTTIRLNEDPPDGLQMAFPGVRGLTFTTYDATSVSGIVTPNVTATTFYVGSLDEIPNYQFVPKAGATAINIFFKDNITGVGPDASWIQIAACDASGVAGVYAATGASFGTPPISASAIVSASGLAGDWTIAINSSGTGDDTFRAADFVYINPGQPTSEVVRVVSVAATSLTLKSGLNSPHATGEPIYVCVRQFSAQETTPEGATGGLAQAFFNMSLEVKADKVQRIT
jgi:hypothetical protein